MGLAGSKESTIDRNGAGGDAGVAAKRNAILSKLDKMKQPGVPTPKDSGAVGAEKRPGSSTYKGGSSPKAQKSVPGGKSKQ